MQQLCVGGKKPSIEVQKHLASCRLCFDSLAVLGELVKSGSSLSLYATGCNTFACENIDSEMDWIAAMSFGELTLTNPVIAGHINECGVCSERYTSSQLLLEAEGEGLFGGDIGLPEKRDVPWSQIKEKVFELTRTITAILDANTVGFYDLDSQGLPGVLVATPSGVVRSSSTGAVNSDLKESQVELSPPTLSNRLIFRVVYEAEGHVTAEFEIVNQITERLVIALYEVERNDSLVEVRSITESQPVIKFERLSPRNYIVEIRGHGGKSRIPLNLEQKEK